MPGRHLSPDLKMGTIAALLNDCGIYPLEKEEVKIRSNNGAISEAQLISSVAGIPSGPAAELGDSILANLVTSYQYPNCQYV